MTIKEFAETYEMNISAIYQKIKRNSDVLSGHIKIENGVQQLDDDAVKFLLPKSKQIMNNYILQIKALTEELEKIKAKYNEEISEYSKKLTESYADYGKLDKQIYEMQQHLNEVVSENQMLKQEYQTALLQIEELNNKIGAMGEKRKLFFGKK